VAVPEKEPVTELLQQFSSEGATATPWADGRRVLETADVYWLSTVRPDGRPHVTPVVAVWLDGAVHFTCGPTEQKAHNLAQNSHCIITTGCNSLSEGLDLVVEGDALPVREEATLRPVADKFAAKYESPFRFTVRDSALYSEGREVLTYRVTPTKAFAYGRGQRFSATRWRFERERITTSGGISR
jgi:nitroimidazol reductase NimA-like FMN-containing flavoprotein (pyridoxamine 5'-phosphate oxidase superfamily)